MKCGLFLVCLVALLIAPAKAEEVRIAVVDMKKVFHAHPAAAGAEDRVRESQVKAREAFVEKTNALKQILEEHQKLLLSLDGASGEAAAAKRAEAKNLLDQARILESEVADFKAAQEAELERMFLAEKNRILEAITAAIRELNADGKYHLVIDRSAAAANGMPAVIDVRGLDDLTDAVIASLK